MGWRRKKKKEPPRGALLSATPIRNPEATSHEVGNDGLEVRIPVHPGRIARWLARKHDAPLVRRFQLDALGIEVWRMLDGQTTVRGMIETFAASHRLNLREAEVSMLTYLRQLAQRGIMVLAWPKNPNETPEISGFGKRVRAAESLPEMSGETGKDGET